MAVSDLAGLRGALAFVHGTGSAEFAQLKAVNAEEFPEYVEEMAGLAAGAGPRPPSHGVWGGVGVAGPAGAAGEAAPAACRPSEARRPRSSLAGRLSGTSSDLGLGPAAAGPAGCAGGRDVACYAGGLGGRRSKRRF